MNREFVETFVETNFVVRKKVKNIIKRNKIYRKNDEEKKTKIGDKNKNDPATVSRENIVVITCLTQTILRFMEIGIPAKISTGITKWMQNRFELVEWTTRNEIRCGCEDPRPEYFSFKSISFWNARYFVVCLAVSKSLGKSDLSRTRIIITRETVERQNLI